MQSKTIHVKVTLFGNLIPSLGFSKGNPDNFNGEDCLSILINNGYWNDDNCESKRGYICKRRGEMRRLNCCC